MYPSESVSLGFDCLYCWWCEFDYKVTNNETSGRCLVSVELSLSLSIILAYLLVVKKPKTPPAWFLVWNLYAPPRNLSAQNIPLKLFPIDYFFLYLCFVHVKSLFLLTFSIPRFCPLFGTEHDVFLELALFAVA